MVAGNQPHSGGGGPDEALMTISASLSSGTVEVPPLQPRDQDLGGAAADHLPGTRTVVRGTGRWLMISMSS